MVLGVEICLLTIPLAVSTQADLVFNCEKGVHVSCEESGLTVWFQRIQAAVKSKAACFTVSIVGYFFRLSYGLVSSARLVPHLIRTSQSAEGLKDIAMMINDGLHVHLLIE